MSNRTTADIVADLLDNAEQNDSLLIEAADRLTELSRKEVHAEAHRAAFHRLYDLEELRPPCPTCGGTHRIKDAWADEFDCSDCVDGKMSWADMSAQGKALHEFPREDATAAVWVALQALRAVRAEVTE